MERKKLTDEYFNEIYPFTPNISNKDEPSVQKFFNRLQDWVDKRNDKIELDIISSFYDTKTGQKLFKPIISESNKDSTDHRKENNLFDYLHLDKITREKNRDQLGIDASNEAKEISNLKLLSENSEQINSLLKEDCFECLFNTFDHDKDEVINCTESFVKNAEEKLDKNLLEIFNPIFIELKETEETLSKEEFYMAIEELFKVLTVTQKRNLINWYVNQKRESTNERRSLMKINPELTFHPKISENSSNFFSCSKRYSKDFLERNRDLKISREDYYRVKSKEKYEMETEGKFNFLKFFC